jgi:hypothetical protein
MLMRILRPFTQSPDGKFWDMSDYLENKIVDHVFRNRSYTVPTTIYVGLYTTSPTDANSGTEVSGGSYARVQVGPSDAAWQSTQGTTTAVASSGTGGQTSNGSTITFPTPSANWGTITHVGILDAVTAGNLLVWGALTASKNVNNGDPAPAFAATALTITFA